MLTFIAGYTLCLGISLMLLTVSKVDTCAEYQEQLIWGVGLTLVSGLILS